MSPVFHQLYYQKATAPSLCARTNSRRSRATLIDRKNIIAAEFECEEDDWPEGI